MALWGIDRSARMTHGSAAVRSGVAVGALWVVDDFPEVSVGVAKVAGVDAPGAVVNLGDRRPRCLGSREQRVDLVTGCDDLTEAEFAALRWPRSDPCVLGKLAARVEGEDAPAVEPEHRDCAGWVSIVTDELGCGHAGRLEAERTVEGKRPLKVATRSG